MSNGPLAEFHKFEYQDKHYLFKVNAMRGYQINAELSTALEALRDKEEIDREALDPDLREALEALRIMEDPLADKLAALNENLPERAPVTAISLNVAQLCNLSCIYCYGVDGEYGEKGYMKHRTAFDSVDWLIENSLHSPAISIVFFGGEPLLNFPLIKKVVKYAKEQAAANDKEIFFGITTNGTLFNDEVNAFLNEHKISVTVSFDGDPDMQNKNRPFKGGQGSFEVAKDKVEAFLKSRGGKATGRATITGNNTDLAKVREALVKNGFNKVSTTQVTLPSNSIFVDEKAANGKSNGQANGIANGKPASSCGSDGQGSGGCGKSKSITGIKTRPVRQSFPVQLIDPPKAARAAGVKTAKIMDQEESQITGIQHRKMIEDVEFVAADTLHRIKHREPLYEHSVVDIVAHLHARKRKTYFCGAGRGYLGVSISGDIYPCHRFVGQDEHKLGNIRDWDAGVQKPFIENYGMSHPKCSGCFARYFCGGGCFHDSIQKNGSMAAPNDEYCQKMRKEVEMGIFLYDQLNDFDKMHLGLIRDAERPSGVMNPEMTEIPEEVQVSD